MGAPTWETARDQIRAVCTPETHVVTIIDATAVALTALDRQPGLARSLAIVGMFLPDASLRTLGFGSFVDALTNLNIRAPQPYDLTPGMKDASPEELQMANALVLRDLDLDRFAEFGVSWEAMDLLRLRPLVELPALYLELPAAFTVFAEGELWDTLLSFLPRAQLKALRQWPLNLHDPAGSTEISDPVIEFILGLSAADTS
ncbi:MAG: hypothetical protein WEB00_13840 [Dehalococcoidia bacterium]